MIIRLHKLRRKSPKIKGHTKDGFLSFPLYWPSFYDDVVFDLTKTRDLSTQFLMLSLFDDFNYCSGNCSRISTQRTKGGQGFEPNIYFTF